MARVLADDLDKTVDSEEAPVRTYRFGWGLADADSLAMHEIDLTEANFKKMTELLADYLDVATEVEPDAVPAAPKAAKKANARRSQAVIDAEKKYNAARDAQRQLIVAWSKTEGLSPATRGAPVGQEGLDKFYAAHSGELVLYGQKRVKRLPKA